MIIADSLTEQHATWLAVNPVLGCPKSCDYCFLRPENLNRVTPKELRTPQEAINGLTASNLYTPNLPVAIGTRTDMFSTPSNIDYYQNFLKQWNQDGIPNPLIMITKCKVPEATLMLLKEAQRKGTKPLFFLSYSGLDHTIEKGIDHKLLRENFKNLKKAGIPVIHYWRPFVPQNSSLEKMYPVINLAVENAMASVIDGLRMTPEMIKQFSFWPELQEANIDLANTESIYTSDSQQNLAQLQEEFPGYPMLYASSCALANVTKTPDYNGVYGTSVCERSSCPLAQRNICGSFHRNRHVEDSEIQENLARLNIHGEYQSEVDDRGIITLVVDVPLEHGVMVNLVQALKMKVRPKSILEAGYGWGSHHDRKTITIK